MRTATPQSPLKIAASSRATLPEPPRDLGGPGRVLWDNIQHEYRIADPGGVELLAQACVAATRAEELADVIKRDGMTIETQIGMKGHPVLKDELACRAFVCRVLERLGVNVEAVKPVGRPPRGFG